jgi:hypothetical protein
MTLRDSVGYPVSGATAHGLETFERATLELRCLIRDPLATVNEALTANPDLTLGYALRAYLNLLGTEPAGIAVAREACSEALGKPATDRERRHLVAAAQLANGHWHEAGRTLEDLSIDYPRDLLALQVGHQIDFFTGEARTLRDRVARVLPSWSPAMLGYHAVLGMHAFGLEECGEYAQAERQGRRAVELESRDCWAQHAVAHVCEMQVRQRDGIAWMRDNIAGWVPESFLVVHNWWHLALYHLDLGEIAEVLTLYDGPMNGGQSGVVMDMLDASALLWRLQLRGVDVGDRWANIADRWAPLATAGNYAFNDLHAVMAFIGAGRPKALAQVFETQAEVMRGDSDNARFTREVGSPACRAFVAFSDGDYAETIRLLRAIRPIAQRFGGSHAQRDVLDLTLIEAAFRGGGTALHAALAAERLAVKPASPLAQMFVARSRDRELNC